MGTACLVKAGSSLCAWLIFIQHSSVAVSRTHDVNGVVAWRAGHRAWACCSWPFRRKKKRYRSIPGVPKQFKLLLRRAGVKWVRGWSYKFIDMLLFVGAALVVGALVVSVLVDSHRGCCAVLCCTLNPPIN